MSYSVDHRLDSDPDCIGQWCCGCETHPIGKPWGHNHREWGEHYDRFHADGGHERNRLASASVAELVAELQARGARLVEPRIVHLGFPCHRYELTYRRPQTVLHVPGGAA